MSGLYIPSHLGPGGLRQEKIDIVSMLTFIASDIIEDIYFKGWEKPFCKERLIESVNDHVIDIWLPGDSAAKSEIWNRVAEAIMDEVNRRIGGR